MRREHLLLAVAFAASVTLPGCARQTLHASTPALRSQVIRSDAAPLRILLTNDDGIDAPGIVALHHALGAHPDRYAVTVVAPAHNRSGSGMSRTKGDIPVVRRSERSWAVIGTPADCVVGALAGILPSAPDLVVSGMNDGANLGRVALTSGTVGAAMTAALLAVPAIAVSVGPVDGGSLTPRDVFPDAAVLTLRIIDAAAAHAALPPGRVLSVNYPAFARERIRGVRVTQQADFPLKSRRYDLVRSGIPRPDGHRMMLVRRRSKRLHDSAAPDADTAAFAAGFVTVTPMDGDWTAADALEPINELLSGFASP